MTGSSIELLSLLLGTRADSGREATPKERLPFPFGLLSRKLLSDLFGVLAALLLPVSLPKRLLALGLIRIVTAIGRRLLRRSGSPTAQFLDRLLASGQRLR